VATHVVDILKAAISPPDASNITTDVVCTYYCGDEDEPSDNICNIYRRILAQILSAQPDLKKEFLTRFGGNTSLARDRGKLEEFLDHIAESFCTSRPRRWLYVVIDGVDECLNTSCQSLLPFLERWSKAHPCLKIFLTSRHLNDIKEKLPEQHTRTQKFEPLEENYRLIAEHHVQKWFGDRYFKLWGSDTVQDPETVREYIVNSVWRKADCSAIWITTVLKGIREKRYTTEGKISKYIADVPVKLFNMFDALFKTCAGEDECNRELIWSALEILIIAKVHLQRSELAYAVQLWNDLDNFKTEAELKEAGNEDEGRILGFLSPFLKQDGADMSRPTEVSVHQSVKDWVTRRCSKNQILNPSEVTGEEVDLHVQRMHKKMALACLKYLQYPEFSTKILFRADLPTEVCFGPNGYSQASVFSRGPSLGAMFIRTTPSLRDSPAKSDDGHDPRKWKFYLYSAYYWFDHVRGVQDMKRKRSPDIDVFVKNSLAAKNWGAVCSSRWYEKNRFN
jgi:hypothetical protein